MTPSGVAGAPITNLVSNYGNHHWSAGIAETDHIETGQQRIGNPRLHRGQNVAVEVVEQIDRKQEGDGGAGGCARYARSMMTGLGARVSGLGKVNRIT